MISRVQDLHRRYAIAAIVVMLALTGFVRRSFLFATEAQPNDVEQMMERFLIEFSDRDVAAFSKYFADDATMFFPTSTLGVTPNRVQTREGIAQGFKALYARSGPARNPGSRIVPQDMQVQRFGDAAIVTFLLGNDSLRGRRSFVLRRTGSEWKIVHLHASTIGSSSR